MGIPDISYTYIGIKEFDKKETDINLQSSLPSNWGDDPSDLSFQSRTADVGVTNIGLDVWYSAETHEIHDVFYCPEVVPIKMLRDHRKVWQASDSDAMWLRFVYTGTT